MANMSYCRFENTYHDLKDCVTAMEEAMDEGVSLEEFTREMSKEERIAFSRMVNLCAAFKAAYEDITNGKDSFSDEDELDLSDKCFD